MPLRESLQPLRSAPFRLLAAGQALSWLGDALVTVALAVAIVQSGGSATELGLVIGSGMASRMVLMLLGGVWADRLRPQAVMVACDLLRAGAQLLLAWELSGPHPRVMALCALYIASGAAAAFFRPALASLQPLVVPAGQRHAANGFMGLLQSAANVAGPALAGILLATTSPSLAFLVNAGTYLLSAASLARVRVPAVRAARRRMWAELRDGWAEVRARDWYWKNLLGHGVWNTAFGVLTVLGPVVAIRHLGGAGAVGAIGSAIGVGGVVGGFAAMSLRPRRPLMAANAGLALMALLAASYVWPVRLPVVMACAALAMLGLAFLNACWGTIVQERFPHAVLARVSSWDELTSFVGIPLGNAVAGPLAAAFGTDRTLVGVAVMFAGASFAPLLSASVRRLDAVPVAPRAAELASGVAGDVAPVA